MPEHECEEKSRSIAERVRRAVEIQERRFRNLLPADTGRRRNSRIPAGCIDSFCRLCKEGEQVFREAVDRHGLSGRACHGILRVGRTIADLDGSEEIKAVHILEAVEFHRLGEDPYDILTLQN